MTFLIWTVWTIFLCVIAFATYTYGMDKGYKDGHNKAMSEAYKTQESKHVDRRG